MCNLYTVLDELKFFKLSIYKPNTNYFRTPYENKRRVYQLVNQRIRRIASRNMSAASRIFHTRKLHLWQNQPCPKYQFHPIPNCYPATQIMKLSLFFQPRIKTMLLKTKRGESRISTHHSNKGCRTTISMRVRKE